MKKAKILAETFGDITGDGIYDKIVLIGNYIDEDKSTAFENLQLLITDGNSKKIYSVPISNIVGYTPTLYLFPFRDPKISDIFISIPSGGSGGFNYNYIFGYKDNKFVKLFDNKQFEKMFNYKVEYIDEYQVQIINEKLQKKFLIDITYKDQEYLDDIYHDDGNLKKAIFGNVLGLNQVFPIDVDNNGVFELLTMQRVVGLYNADLLGYLETVLAWKDNKFDIFHENQYLAQISF